MPTRPGARGDAFRLRLALAFLGVALAAVALLADLVAARRITRPVAKLIAVTQAMTAEDRSAWAGPVRALPSCASWRPRSTRWPHAGPAGTDPPQPRRRCRPRAARPDRGVAGRA
jgi:hypothetical protein